MLMLINGSGLNDSLSNGTFFCAPLVLYLCFRSFAASWVMISTDTCISDMSSYKRFFRPELSRHLCILFFVEKRQTLHRYADIRFVHMSLACACDGAHSYWARLVSSHSLRHQRILLRMATTYFEYVFTSLARFLSCSILLYAHQWSNHGANPPTRCRRHVPSRC